MWKAVSGSGALALIVLSVLAIWMAPELSIPSTGHHHWSAVKDYGPALSGLWVISAALISIYAVAATMTSARKDTIAANEGTIELARKLCISEIQVFLDRINSIKLKDNFTGYIRAQELPDSPSDVFRIYLGTTEIFFSRVEPSSLVLLGVDTGAAYLALGSRVKRVAARFNWFNSANIDHFSKEGWLIQNEVLLGNLTECLDLARAVLNRLGDSVTKVETFTISDVVTYK